MALKKTLDLLNNFGTISTLQDCYIAVIEVVGDKNNVGADIGIYSNNLRTRLYKQQRIEFVPDMNGKNFITQAYDAVKLMPEFVGSEDC